MRSRFTNILLVILAIALWGCSSEDSKPGSVASDDSLPQAQSAVGGLLSALYTVSVIVYIRYYWKTWQGQSTK